MDAALICPSFSSSQLDNISQRFLIQNSRGLEIGLPLPPLPFPAPGQEARRATEPRPLPAQSRLHIFVAPEARDAYSHGIRKNVLTHTFCENVTPVAQIKEFVANLERNGGNLVLLNNNLWGKNAFRNQAAVLNTAARLDELAALPETDIVRDAAIRF